MLCFSKFGSETRDLAVFLREFGSEAQVRVGNPAYTSYQDSVAR